MKSVRFLYYFLSRKVHIQSKINIFSGTYASRDCFKIDSRCFTIYNANKKMDSDNEYFDDSGELYQTENFEKSEYVRNLLFKDSTDRIIKQLNDSASVEDVMNIVDQYNNSFTPEHITHTVLVLKDLQNAYFYYNGFRRKLLDDFNTSLLDTQGFKDLLKIIKNNHFNFKGEMLSYLFLYIHKLGLSSEDDLMQDIALKLREGLRKDFCLSICSKFLTVIFHERSIRPYNISLEFLPKVISSIGKFSYIWICSNILTYM